MLLPTKVLPINKCLLYQSLIFYSTSKKEISVNTFSEMQYVVILYAIGYVDYKRGDCDEFRIYKIKW